MFEMLLSGTYESFEKSYPDLCERLSDEICTNGGGAGSGSAAATNVSTSSFLSSNSSGDGSSGTGGGVSAGPGVGGSRRIQNFSNSACEGSLKISLCNLRISCSQPVTPAKLVAPIYYVRHSTFEMIALMYQMVFANYTSISSRQ